MDPSIFIEDNVLLFKDNYYKKMIRTKIAFFKHLKAGDSLKKFEKDMSKIWGNLNFEFMNKRLQELEVMIDEINKVENGSTIDFFPLENEAFFQKKIDDYMNNIKRYYRYREETIKKGIEDKEEYLSKFVEKYDDFQASIPYKNKDGSIRAWHNIADYCSMVFNTNMRKIAWNRTIGDADYLERDLMYLIAHPYSCPKCMQYQGKVYSISGKDPVYPSMQMAIDGGVGHPRCKHIWVIHWGDENLQGDLFNSNEWIEKYRNDQKKKATELEIKKTNGDLKIYKSLGQEDRVECLVRRLEKLEGRLLEF